MLSIILCYDDDVFLAGVSIENPESNLDQSILIVRFPSGIGVEVQEVQGYLHATAYVPREIQVCITVVRSYFYDLERLDRKQYCCLFRTILTAYLVTGVAFRKMT